MEFCPGKGVLKREKFPNTRKPSHCRICAELWKHRGQHKREKKINKQLKIADCEPYSNAPSREAAQTPASTISKQLLGREAWRWLGGVAWAASQGSGLSTPSAI